MTKEVFSLADILTLEEMRELSEADFSPENIIRKFEKDSMVKKVEYKGEEDRFYITFTDGEIVDLKISLPQKATSA